MANFRGEVSLKDSRTPSEVVPPDNESCMNRKLSKEQIIERFARPSGIIDARVEEDFQARS